MLKRVSETWSDLNRSIYKGKRLRANLRALTIVSVFTAILGLVLIIMDLIVQEYEMIIPSAVTFVAGVICAILSGVVKRRDLAILVPTAFCFIAFTYYAITGAGDGTAILWSLLLPIGMGYFVSVKYSIYLSVYYIVLYSVLFYSPLCEYVKAYYFDGFMARFPILFASMTVFTSIAMIQHHRSILFENEYTGRLNEEVKKQTAVAKERAEKIEQMSFQTIQTLAYAIDAKDPYTKGHSTRVSAYSVKLAEALGWDEERINNLRYAALLHDIGKIGVPDSILSNPKRLTAVEYDLIKSHTTMGEDILKDRSSIPAAADVALSHHERYDGGGYPNGISGKEISEEARIVAIADAFDAMSSDRIYRKAYKNDYISHELIKERGRQFDPHFVNVFLKLWDSGLLQDIMREDSAEADEPAEVSSALLQEVMETFTAQNTADEIDVATGIMSRNAGESAIALDMKENEGCFVFFDLDNLKKINDINGHEAGDRILHMVGDTLLENQKGNLCCRLGGDEFILFMKKITKEEATTQIEIILKEFEKKKDGDSAVSIGSLSAGAVMCTPDDDYETVYNKADKALYSIKQNGKNGYVFYSEELEDFSSERVDVHKMVSAIENSGSYRGALDVEYREFTKLYEFVGKMEKRFDQQFKLIMISLDPVPGEEMHEDELDRAMYYMEKAILQTIRDVDIFTKYNRQQVLVILLGTDEAGVKSAVDRIFRGFFKMNGSGGFSPSYTVVEKGEV